MNEPAIPSHFRLFIAIPVPEAVKTGIEEAQAELRRTLPRGCARWTKRDQFHLTLRFLGNVEAKRVPELAASVRTACRSFSPLKLRAERIGCFPDLRFPRVVWVWVHDEAGRLVALQKTVGRAVVGFVEDKTAEDFTGHVTIARTKNIKRPQVEILAKMAHGMTGKVFGEWTAEAIEIMRSELSPGGSQHSCLVAIPLGSE